MTQPCRRPSFLTSLATLIRRDLVVEYRTREIVTGGVTFALLVLVVFNFAIDLRAENAADVAPGILWICFAFAGILGFGRSFADDRDRGTLDGLLLAPIERGVVYLARTVSNTIFMAIVELVSLPVFVALYDVRLAWGQTLLAVALGTVGFAGTGTLVAALAANSRAREVLLPLLLLPLAVPVLIASVKATAAAIGARPPDDIPWLQFLAGFDVVLVAASFLVFEYILEE
jgi:heme exporter protein B